MKNGAYHYKSSAIGWKIWMRGVSCFDTCVGSFSVVLVYDEIGVEYIFDCSAYIEV